MLKQALSSLFRAIAPGDPLAGLAVDHRTTGRNHALEKEGGVFNNSPVTFSSPILTNTVLDAKTLIFSAISPNSRNAVLDAICKKHTGLLPVRCYDF